MLMTQQDLKNLIAQVNEAFKGQFNRLGKTEERLEALEAQMSDLLQQAPKAPQKAPRAPRKASKET